MVSAVAHNSVFDFWFSNGRLCVGNRPETPEQYIVSVKL